MANDTAAQRRRASAVRCSGRLDGDALAGLMAPQVQSGQFSTVLIGKPATAGQLDPRSLYRRANSHNTDRPGGGNIVDTNEPSPTVCERVLAL